MLTVDGTEGKHAISFRCSGCGRNRLQLGGVEDLEAAVLYVIERYLQQHGAFLEQEPREEFYDFLVAEAWTLWLTWTPARGVPFAAFLFRYLPLRANQFYRSSLGKDGIKQHVLSGLRPGGHRAGSSLGSPPTPEQGDPSLHSSADLLRVVGH